MEWVWQQKQNKDWVDSHYAQIHVFTQVCHVILGLHVLRVDVTLDLGFHVVIGVGRLTVQQEGFITSTSCEQRTRNSKNKVLFFWMLQSDFVLSSSTQSVAQILAYFTSRTRVFWGVLSTSSKDNSWEKLACEFLRSETSVHQNFPEFLQPLRDFRTCKTWVGRKRVSPFYHGLLFVFGKLWLAWWTGSSLDSRPTTCFSGLSSTLKLDTSTGEVSLSVSFSLSRVSLSLDVAVDGRRRRAWTRRGTVPLLSWRCHWCWMRTGWRTCWHDRNEVHRVAVYPNSIFNEIVIFDRWSIHQNIRSHRKAFRATILLARFRGLSWSIIYPILWRPLWPLDASALLHWRLWLSWDYTTSSKYPFQHSSLLADHFHRRSRVQKQILVPQVQELTQASTYFPKVRRMLLCFFSFHCKTHLGSFHAASRAPCSCHFCLLQRPILKFWSVGATLMRFTWQINPSEGFWSRILVWTCNSFREFHTLDWFLHVWALP